MRSCRWMSVVGLVAVLSAGSGCVSIEKDANLQPKPSWAITKCAPENDDTYAYFVGSSGIQFTEEAARIKASEMARIEAAGTLETKVERTWQYVTSYMPQVVQKDPKMVRPSQDMHNQARNEIDVALQMGKLQSIYWEQRVKRTRFLFGTSVEVTFDSMALLRLPLEKMAHIDGIQRLKDKIDTMMAESVQQAEVLWRNGEKAAAVEKLMTEHVHHPENMVILRQLAVYEEASGDLDSAAMRCNVILHSPVSNSKDKVWAAARLQALVPAQRKDLIDKIVSSGNAK